MLMQDRTNHNNQTRSHSSSTGGGGGSSSLSNTYSAPSSQKRDSSPAFIPNHSSLAHNNHD